MKNFLNSIISKIVDYPDELSIEEQTLGENIFQYQIKANNLDIGKIIGKEGKIIQAIRNLARILAVKENKQIRIEIG